MNRILSISKTLPDLTLEVAQKLSKVVIVKTISSLQKIGSLNVMIRASSEDYEDYEGLAGSR